MNTTEYGGNQQGYGGGNGDALFVDCFGTITTKYRWVRAKVADPSNPGQQIDDPLDNPPSEVIAVEHCVSAAWASSEEGYATATSDNGLGFSPVVTGNGYNTTSISQGTRFKKRPGGQTITLTCSPSAIATSNFYSAIASVNYRSYIIVPKVNLVGVARFYSPHANKFLTGQKVTGTISLGQDPSYPLLVANSWSWSLGSPPESEENITAEEFKRFDANTNVGKKYLMTPIDMEQASFDFFTSRNSTFVVQCDVNITLPVGCRFEGGLPIFKSISNTVESVRPSLSSSQPITGLIQLESSYFQFGNPVGSPAVPGQDWPNLQIIVPAPFLQVGQGCCVQLISAFRELLRTTGPGYPPSFSYATTDALDAGFPYPFHTGGWNLPSLGRFVDSPAQGFVWVPDGGGDNWFKASAKDDFKVWVMFKPPSTQNQDTTWIPLMRYEWNWHVVAEIDGFGNWNLTTSVGGVKAPPEEYFEHPEWTTFSPGRFKLGATP